VHTVPSLSTRVECESVVFVDPSGWCNITARVSLSDYERVCALAKHTVQAHTLHTHTHTQFERTFLTPMPWELQYDAYLCVDVSQVCALSRTHTVHNHTHTVQTHCPHTLKHCIVFIIAHSLHPHTHSHTLLCVARAPPQRRHLPPA